MARKDKSKEKETNKKPARSAAQIARDRVIIARMYLQQSTQMEIAQKLELDQATISRDLQDIQEEWRKSTLIDMNEAKQRELARIDQLEREAWDAWQRSIGEKVEKTKKIKEDGTDETVRTYDEAGDPRYLSVIAECIEKRMKILGLNAPIKFTSFDYNNAPIPVLRRIASGMAPDVAMNEYIMRIDEDKWGKYIDPQNVKPGGS